MLNLRAANLLDDGVRAAWDRALQAPLDVAPTWIHGDLHPLNVLLQGDRLSAVIDWGDLAAGDRATDLACLWMLLPSAGLRQRAIAGYGPISLPTLERARGWAVLFGTLFSATGLTGDERFAVIGERTLRRLVEGP